VPPMPVLDLLVAVVLDPGEVRLARPLERRPGRLIYPR
jgi:hypothetical protein